MNVLRPAVRRFAIRAIALLGCSVLVFALSACGTTDKPADTKDVEDAASATDAGTDAPVANDTAPDTSWTGKCAAGPAFCDDGNPCTIDDCDPQLGCQTSVKDCADDDECTLDACDVGDGGCKHVPNTCDDGNACTSGVCKAGQGCVFAALDCSDNDTCTADGCSPLSGCLNTALDCDDDVSCTTDSCDPAAGCVHAKPPGAVCCEVPADCEDDNACTVHACAGGICQTTAVFGCCKENADCSDENPCTLDTCAKATGQCSNTYQPGAGCCQADADCDDSVACTQDRCVKGQCGHEVQCCASAGDCDKAGAVGLCGASTCTAAGCAWAATPVATCCQPDVAKTGFEASGGWAHKIVAASYGTWKAENSGLSTATNTAHSGVGAATYAAQSSPAPGGQSVSRLVFDEIELSPGVHPKLTFWIRALLVGGSLGDQLRLRLETATGAWLVWQAKGSMSGFQKVEIDLRGFAARPGTRKVRVVFEMVPNAVKSTFTKVWLDDVALTSSCTAPPVCAKDADCDDGLNATSETCSEGACVVTSADSYCEAVAVCNDKNSCTADTCADFGCAQVELPDCCTKSTDCLDTNPCTTDYCSGLKCQHIVKPASLCCFASKDCDDGNPCTLDQCPAVGLGCQHTQTDASCCVADAGCDDKDSCTLDRCAANTCSHQNQCCKNDADCDDNDALCTVDKCGAAGLCSWTPTNAKGCCEPEILKMEFDGGSTAGLVLQSSSTLSKWQLVTGKRSQSGKGSLYYGNLAKGNYDDQKTDGTITTQVLSLPAGEKLTLMFGLWMHTEQGTNYDKFEVWVDTPAKKTKVWDKSAKGFALQKWANWTVDLTAWSGHSVTIRLLFDTNDPVANTTEGVYVDDLYLNRSCKKLTCNTAKDCDDGLPATTDTCAAAACTYTW